MILIHLIPRYQFTINYFSIKVRSNHLLRGKKEMDMRDEVI
jgi:hypothetical protein